MSDVMYRIPKACVANLMGAISTRSTSIASQTSAVYRDTIFHVYTIWLFTQSDIKTIILPKTAFGTLSAIASPAFKLPAIPMLPVLGRIPAVALWCWINLLPFAIENQRQPSAILEDAINKPWRPLPSNRLSPQTARSLAVKLYLIALLASYHLGGLKQSIMLIFLGHWYNDLGGSDRNCLVRNLINGVGFVCFMSGAMEVASGSPIRFNLPLAQWLTVVGLVVASTVHTQDMYDQAGDGARGRRTVPLVLGDGLSRWSIAVAVICWSWICSTLWGFSLGCLAALSLGFNIAWRTLAKRSVGEDKVTFLMWNIWMATLYSLPFSKLALPYK